MWSSTTIPTRDGMSCPSPAALFFCKASSCSAYSVLESRWTSHHRRNSPNAFWHVAKCDQGLDQLFLNLPNYILYGQIKNVSINKYIYISKCIIVGGEQYYRKKESGQVQLSIHVQKQDLRHAKKI